MATRSIQLPRTLVAGIVVFGVGFSIVVVLAFLTILDALETARTDVVEAKEQNDQLLVQQEDMIGLLEEKGVTIPETVTIRLNPTTSTTERTQSTTTRPTQPTQPTTTTTRPTTTTTACMIPNLPVCVQGRGGERGRS